MNFFQNLWIQIAIGFLPAAVVTLLILYKKKIWKMAYVTLTAAVTAVVVCCGVIGVVQMMDTKETIFQPEVETASSKDLEHMAYSLLLGGDTEGARQVLTVYADTHGYDDICTLLNARICMVEQRFESAYGAYRKLYGTNLPEEGRAAEKIVLSYRMDIALAEQLNAAGHDVGTVCSEEEISGLIWGGAQDLVFSAVTEMGIDQNMIDGAQWVIRANDLYDEFLHNGNCDQGILSTLVDEAGNYGLNGVLRKLSVFREARLKVMLLSGDYRAIVRYMDEYACCAEYMTVLELYLAGETDENEISASLRLRPVYGLDQLIRRLEDILRYRAESLTPAQKLKLEDQIAMLSAYKDNKALYALEVRLRSEAEAPRNYRMSSKIYMSLAKLWELRDDLLRRNRYFSDALVKAPASRDGEYSEAMNNLSEVVSGVGNDELVKQIPVNAAKAVSNSYFVPGTGRLIRNDQAEEDMAAAVQDSTIKYSAAITINSVDPSNFETVVLRVQISDEMISEHELQNLLKLRDCNYNIESFKIEKVENQKANIILCCDNSGSMSGSVEKLRNAVNKFLEDSHKKERIGFYTFDDQIIQALPLGTASDRELREAVNAMGDYGGTSIYGTLTSILSSAPVDKDASQVIILMTDGQDGDNPSMEDINTNIGQVASRKGYAVYVLGMGSDIDYNYLVSIAQSAGGRCIYSPTDAELESLYQFIHGALRNQYEITFTAKDTLTAQGRRVEVVMEEQNVGSSKIYSVGNEDAENASVDFDQGVCVNGLSHRLVFRQKNNVEIFVNGCGFKSTDFMYLNFYGERNYTVSTEYVSDTQFRVILPEEMAEGVYDMEVYLSGRRALYLQELTVVEGEPDEIIFGGYHFKAYKIQETSSGYYLSNYVVMNDWLHFNGSVTLTGDLDDSEMILTDNHGSYVDYADTTAQKGFAVELKNKGIPLNVPALGSLTIYNAAAYGTSYPTVSHDVGYLELVDLIGINHPKLHLYPDRITLEMKSGECKLPMQDYFITVMREEYSPFSVDFDATGTITGKNVDVSIKVAANYVESDTALQALVIDFLDMRSSLQKDMLSLEINTLTGFYKLGFNVKIPVFNAWVGASWWYENGGFDGLELRCDKDFTTKTTVPITFSDFKIGLDDFTDTKVTVAPCDLHLGTLNGGFKASAYKVSALIPALEKYVGDLSLVSVDAELSTRLGVLFIYNLQGKATLKMLDLIDLAGVEMKVGNFTHTDALLGMDESTVDGFYFSIVKQLKIDIHNFMLDFKGSQKEFVMTNRFIGLRYSGGVDFKLDWWGFDPKFHADGALTTGFFEEESGKIQFTVRASWTDGNKRRGILYYIRDDGKKVKDTHYNY